MKTLPTKFLLLVFGFLAGCSTSKVQPQSGQNVLLITIDTLRADRLGCYGYSRGTTPNIDRLAREGVLFEDAIAQVPVTLPSHVSLLTSTFPPVNGVRDNTYFRLDPEALTLAEIFQTVGYQTGAFVGAYVLDASFGLGQGFDVYDARMKARGGDAVGTFSERRANEVVDAFGRWLGEADPGKPFFAWVHLFDPHTPYAAPSPFRERYVSSPYDGEIAYVDDQIGVLLKELDARGLEDNTLIVLTSDHGESLGEHGERTHGFFVYDATLKVPLMLSGKQSLPANKSISGQVRLVDVVPTILDLVDVAVPDMAQGVSLVGLIEGANSEKAVAYSECYTSQLNFGWAPLASLRQDGFKYIDAPSAELYDLTKDPGEIDNLLSADRERARSMKSALEALQSSWPGSFSARHQPDPDTLARLRSLGYAGGGVDTPAEDTTLLDPKDGLHLWDKSQWVIHHIGQGDYAEAARQAESILEEDPTNLLAMEHLAISSNKQGLRREAIDLYRRISSLAPERPLPHLHLGNLLWLEGNLGEAEKEFKAALQTDSRFARVYERLGYLYLTQGKPQQAYESFQGAIRIDDASTDARLGLARYHRGMKEFDDARAEYALAVETDPQNGKALAEYAHLVAQLGELSDAEELLRSGPEDLDIHYTLSAILRETERMADALAELDKAIALAHDFAPAHHDRGVILSRLGRADEAIPSFETALRLREDPATRNALGTTLCRVNRCSEAIPHFEQALRVAPNTRMVLENLSEAYRLAGRNQAAEEMRQRASRLQE